jgi:hypothetical protein
LEPDARAWTGVREVSARCPRDTPKHTDVDRSSPKVPKSASPWHVRRIPILQGADRNNSEPPLCPYKAGVTGSSPVTPTSVELLVSMDSSVIPRVSLIQASSMPHCTEWCQNMPKYGTNVDKQWTRDAPGLDQMVTRVCRSLSRSKEILVLNDEAHHCYQRRISEEEPVQPPSREEKAEPKEHAQGSQSSLNINPPISGLRSSEPNAE